MKLMESSNASMTSNRTNSQELMEQTKQQQRRRMTLPGESPYGRTAPPLFSPPSSTVFGLIKYHSHSRPDSQFRSRGFKGYLRTRGRDR